MNYINIYTKNNSLTLAIPVKIWKQIIALLILFIPIHFYAQSTTNKTIEEKIKKAEQYFSEGNKNEAVRLYNESAYYYRNQEQFEKAITNYNKVLELNTQLPNKRGVALTHSSLALPRAWK